MSFKKGKTPGLDGIPIELCQVFSHKIRKPLIEFLNFSYEKDILTGTQRESAISLLLKNKFT